MNRTQGGSLKPSRLQSTQCSFFLMSFYLAYLYRHIYSQFLSCAELNKYKNTICSLAEVLFIQNYPFNWFTSTSNTGTILQVQLFRAKNRYTKTMWTIRSSANKHLKDLEDDKHDACNFDQTKLNLLVFLSFVILLQQSTAA